MKWLFFDLGSTLIDESDCDRKRISDTVCGSPVSIEVFEEKMRLFAARNENAYACCRDHFGLPKARWDSALEKLYPGVDSALKMLSEKYCLGIIANQSPGVEERLREFGILDDFQVIVSSDEVGVSKPEPRIFQLALERAGCSVSDAVMIGDRLDNDIAPAQTLGFTTVWVRQGYGKYGSVELLSQRPDYVIDNVTELSKIEF